MFGSPQSICELRWCRCLVSCWLLRVCVELFGCVWFRCSSHAAYGAILSAGARSSQRAVRHCWLHSMLCVRCQPRAVREGCEQGQVHQTVQGAAPSLFACFGRCSRFLDMLLIAARTPPACACRFARCTQRSLIGAVRFVFVVSRVLCRALGTLCLTIRRSSRTRSSMTCLRGSTSAAERFRCHPPPPALLFGCTFAFCLPFGVVCVRHAARSRCLGGGDACWTRVGAAAQARWRGKLEISNEI